MELQAIHFYAVMKIYYTSHKWHKQTFFWYLSMYHVYVCTFFGDKISCEAMSVLRIECNIPKYKTFQTQLSVVYHKKFMNSHIKVNVLRKSLSLQEYTATICIQEIIAPNMLIALTNLLNLLKVSSM